MVDTYRKLINKQHRMKKTYQDLFMCVAFIAGNVYNEETKGQKKLAIIRKKLQPFLDTYNDEADAIKLDNALVVTEGEKKGKVVVEADGNYAYSAEGIAKCNKALKELSKKEFDYTPIVVNNPDELDQYVFLKGFVTGVEFKEEEEIEL